MKIKQLLLAIIALGIGGSIAGTTCIVTDKTRKPLRGIPIRGRSGKITSYKIVKKGANGQYPAGARYLEYQKITDSWNPFSDDFNCKCKNSDIPPAMQGVCINSNDKEGVVLELAKTARATGKAAKGALKEQVGAISAAAKQQATIAQQKVKELAAAAKAKSKELSAAIKAKKSKDEVKELQEEEDTLEAEEQDAEQVDEIEEGEESDTEYTETADEEEAEEEFQELEDEDEE